MLGAALATVIGTSPLAGMREHGPQPIAILLGSAGLIFLGITIFLVVQVMRPQSVSYTDVQYARPRRRWLPRAPLYNWRTTIESQQDLYLPCGVKCLTGLRQSMIVEEMTLVALSCAGATAGDRSSSKALCEAQAARAARLLRLRATAAMVATVRGILQAAAPQQLGHLRRHPVRPAGNGGHRHGLRMAVAVKQDAEDATQEATRAARSRRSSSMTCCSAPAMRRSSASSAAASTTPTVTVRLERPSWPKGAVLAVWSLVGGPPAPPVESYWMPLSPGDGPRPSGCRFCRTL